MTDVKIRRVCDAVGKNSGKAKCVHCDELGKICCGGPYSTRRKGKKMVRYIENPACVDCHAGKHRVNIGKRRFA